MPRVTWSVSAGRRGYKDRPTTATRAFERADAPGRIYLERSWIKGPGRVRALKHGTTREAAAQLAEETATARERLLLQGRDAYGETRQAHLFALLDRYHGCPKARKWTPRHRAEQDRCRNFWQRALGDVAVHPGALTPELIEATAAEAADNAGWSPRTEAKYLKYLMAATRWGRRKGRMYQVDPLDGVDLPEVRSDTRRRIYTEDQARALATPDPRVDWRVTLAFALATVNGRRISSILHLWAGLEGSDQESDIAVLEVPVRRPDGTVTTLERMFLHYRAEFDKGGRDEWVPVPPEVREILEAALATPEVRESGWLFPEGRLGFQDARDKPMDATSIIASLHKAEETLGIPRVRGRGFHGAKRLHVTIGGEIAGGDYTLVGDVTGNVSEHVLKTIYRQRDLGRMVLQVDGVGAALRGPNRKNADTKTDRTRGAEQG